MTDFSDLLFEAEKLTHDIEETTELPKVDRSLRQVLEASNELYTRVAQTGAKDIQANLLLGSKGIDLPRIAQKLDLISSKRTFEAVEPVDDINVIACLQNEISNCILSIIEEEHKKCFTIISEQTWEHQQGEWKQEKRKILNAMTGPSSNYVALGKKPTAFLEPSIGTALLGKEEALYAMKVMEYNLAATRGLAKPNIITLFSKAAEDLKDTKVNNMWEIIKYMTALPPFPRDCDAIAVRSTETVTEVLVTQAMKYLEDRYKTYMNNIINENLLKAQRGGVPGTYPLVRSFVGIRLQGEYMGLQDGLIEERPIWPMVYYCLRCGDFSAALHCLKQSNVECEDIKRILEMKFNTTSDPEMQKMESMLRFQYRRYIRNSTDPFKRIVWSVLGCCDIADEHSEVAKTADDYLWLKLSLVRINYEKEDHIDYQDLQKTIIDEYGESHYDALNQPHLYFQVLALTGQFEAACEFLVRIQRYRVHAVHIAIALSELYLIAGPPNYSSPLLVIDPADQKPFRRLNVVRLIMLYVQKFEITCIEEAVNYFFLLNNLTNEKGKNMYMVCVGDLAQETRDYEKLFGRMLPNGTRCRGLLDQFTTGDATPEQIAELIATQLADKGMYEDAIDMYDICNNQTEVLSLLCRLLSQVVHLPTQLGSLRDRLRERAKEIGIRYESGGYNCTPDVVASFTTLKDLLVFFDHYHNKQYSLALKTLNEMRLIPLQESDLDERVNSFKRLNVDVCKVLPDVLLATMNMLFDQYQKIKSNEYIPNRCLDLGIDKQLKFIREQAKVLTNFTGMVPYRMPGDTNSRLVQMEILMH